MKLLVTGGAGFIGCNFVRYMLQARPENEIVVLDKLTYSGRLENLEDVLDKITFLRGDICKKKDVRRAIKDCDAVINFAAETHVDKSIVDAGAFVKTDVLGTYVLLEVSRSCDIASFIQISTDEVYGSIVKGSFREGDALDPSSPYSASKAGADMLCMAYYKTYGMNVIVTRSSNNFGPYQYPEKIIPLFIINLLKGKKVPVYGDGQNVRDWLYVLDNCFAIDLALRKGRAGEIYNIASGNEIKNIDLTKKILEILSKDESYIEHVPDRPGHDWRYSLGCHKIRKLGWKPRYDFDKSLRKTVKWYMENKHWWETCLIS